MRNLKLDIITAWQLLYLIHGNYNMVQYIRSDGPHHWPPTQFLAQGPPGITFHKLYKSLVIWALFENYNMHATPSHATQLYLFLPSNNLGNILHPQPTATI